MRNRPGSRKLLAPVQDPVVQAERPVTPKLDRQRLHAISRPIIGTWYGAEGKLRRVPGNLLLQRESPLQRARLARCPGADLAVFGPSREIGVCVTVADLNHRAANPHLPA